ncbi:MAG TPA: RsmE family RNA methyltransferase [Acidimicrobiales bacterium]|nr:RsmE family RNA methyltransferase [Acidimicrobiales bacterium]
MSIRIAAAHVFVGDPSAPELDPADAHHLERVLRLRDGETVTASDGAGRVVTCRVVRAGKTLELAPDGPVLTERLAQPLVTVAMAPVKGERVEWAVQKLTELGVDEIVPLVCRRSVVRWDGERGERHIERLARVAREAAMQCRRAHLPIIGPVRSVAEALAAAAGAGLAPCAADMGGEPPTLSRPFVLVGPEGGWEEDELPTDLPRVALAEHVLRTETAAVTAAALLGGLRSGLVVSADPAE